LRTVTAGRWITRSASDVLGRIRSVTNRMRIAALDRAEARELARPTESTVEERQGDLRRFYDRYETLVETLCDVAQYGPSANLQRIYADTRAAYLQEYAPVRAYILAFLKVSDEDDSPNGHPGDAYELLAASEDIDDFLRMDDGSMISRFMRTREALNLYGEHLRLLAARTQ